MMLSSLTKNKHRQRRQSRRGSTLVEMSIVLPLIMLFFTMMFELCRVLMLQHTADTAAYEAARAVMVPGATSAEAHQVAQQMLDAAGLTQTTIEVTPDTIVEGTALISVRVDIPVNDNSWIAPTQLGNFVVSSELTLMCERPPIVRLAAMNDLKLKKSKIKGKKGT